MKTFESLKLTVQNITGDIRMNIVSPKNITEIKKELKRIDVGKKAQYRVVRGEWNGINIGTPNYFQELSTIDEIIKGVKEIEKDMKKFENISHEDLCDFLFSNVDEEEYRQLVEETIDYDDYMYDLSIEEVWDYLNWEDKQLLAESYIDFEELVREETNNSEIVQCLFDNTNFTIKEIIDKIQKGDTEDEAE